MPGVRLDFFLDMHMLKGGSSVATRCQITGPTRTRNLYPLPLLLLLRLLYPLQDHLDLLAMMGVGKRFAILSDPQEKDFLMLDLG
jgi:hypothetical protein